MWNGRVGEVLKAGVGRWEGREGARKLEEMEIDEGCG
jgi:hypothetical protein